MSKTMIKAFFGIMAAWGEFPMADAATTTTTTTGAASFTVDANCKLSNDFEYAKCGSGATIKCCKTREKCVGPVKPKIGAEMFTCSEARQLTGSKAVKIVILPMFGMIMDILIIAFMVVKLNIAKNHVTKACVAVIVVSWPLFLSSMWAKGFYAGFLALLVAFMSEHKDAPWWIYRLTWALAIFQVIALFGPYEAFHVPIYNQSKGSNTDIITKTNPSDEAACDKFYDKYFTVLGIEKQAEKADPDAKYYGLCTMEWIATVQTFCLFQGMIWMVLVILSAPQLLGEGLNKVQEIGKDLVGA
jgi:hypothetical protein